MADPVVTPLVVTPSQVRIVDGNFQSTPINTNFAKGVFVQMLDTTGAPMQNVRLDCTLPAPTQPSGSFQPPGSGQFYTALTDAINGSLRLPIISANNVSGGWQGLIAYNPDPTIFIRFSANNISNTAPPAPTTATVASGGNQRVASGGAAFPLPLIITVLDQVGAPFPGSPVTFTIPLATNGRFTNTGNQSYTIATDANGQASTGQILSGSAVGNWNMSVSAAVPSTFIGPDTQAATTTVQFTNSDTSTPVNMNYVAGNFQSVDPNLVFGSPLQVRVTNSLGAGVFGVNVTFTAPASGASCVLNGSNVQTVATDSNGIGTSSLPIANATLGQYNVTASSPGLSSIRFTMKNGASYQATVCTAEIAAPSGFANTVIGGAGASPSSWLGPQNAGAPAQGATFAQVQQLPPNTNLSYYMRATPSPASWYSQIDNGAKIISITLKGWKNSSFATSAAMILYSAYILQGNALGRQQVPGGEPQNTWIQFTVTFTPSSQITGAQVKDPTSGWGLQVGPNAASSNDSNMFVNGATMIICYQNPISIQPAHIGVPLHYNMP